MSSRRSAEAKVRCTTHAALRSLQTPWLGSNHSATGSTDVSRDHCQWLGRGLHCRSFEPHIMARLGPCCQGRGTTHALTHIRYTPGVEPGSLSFGKGMSQVVPLLLSWFATSHLTFLRKVIPHQLDFLSQWLTMGRHTGDFALHTSTSVTFPTFPPA